MNNTVDSTFDNLLKTVTVQGRIQNFKLGGGAHLKKLRRAEGGTNIFGVFRVKTHDFTPKNHIFSNFRGGARRVRPLDPPLLSIIEIIHGVVIIDTAYLLVYVSFHLRS